jgi:hypothetical protein
MLQLKPEKKYSLASFNARRFLKRRLPNLIPLPISILPLGKSIA